MPGMSKRTPAWVYIALILFGIASVAEGINMLINNGGPFAWVEITIAVLTIAVPIIHWRSETHSP
jgi:O-antigen/teichoic acid export membrane protein